eukprot:TRINITY_DN69337_c0_g1_i1.p1 TRINITY_DN69337_c0_g1~~TRINITY_DN69337_c0_g1_i1.p1  ORF type:complete len:488 (-),score=54.41 TRINITY_DN69337_c0_g1_i1:165-1628(-)
MVAPELPRLQPPLAVVLMVKGMIGMITLTMPRVFGHMRLVASVIGTLVLGALSFYGSWRVVECRVAVSKLAEDQDMNDCDCGYDQTPKASEIQGAPSGLERLGTLSVVSWYCFGWLGLIAVGLGIVFNQLTALVMVLDCLVRTLGGPNLIGSRLPSSILRVIICALLSVVGSLRPLERVARVAVVAIFVYAYLIFALVYYGSLELANDTAPDPRSAWLPPSGGNLISLIGTLSFGMSNPTLTACAFDDMRLKSARPFLPLLITAYIFVVVGNIAVGTFGFLAYGDSARELVYLNFPPGSVGVILGEIVLCTVLIITCPLIMYPLLVFLEAAYTFANHIPDGWSQCPAFSSSDLSDEDGSELVAISGRSVNYRNASFGSSNGEERKYDRNDTSVELLTDVASWSTFVLTATILAGVYVVSRYIRRIIPAAIVCGCLTHSYLCFGLPGMCHLMVKSGSLSIAEIIIDWALIATCFVVIGTGIADIMLDS